MKAHIWLYGIFLILISCVKTENNSPKILVDLHSNVIDNPFTKIMTPLEFIDSIPSGFKGLINEDSSFVMLLNTVSSSDLEEKIKTSDSGRTKIYALSGYNKGKQYYVLDINDNKDFGDDKIVEFDKSITKNKNYREFFEVHTIEVSTLEGNKWHKQQTYYQFLPAPDYFTYEQETRKEKFQHSLQLAALQHDFLYGTFEVDDNQYGIGFNKGWNGYEFILKKTDTAFYSRNHQLYARYLLKDTIKLQDKYFRIDSLSAYPPKVTINEIDFEGTHYGFRPKEVSKNFKITSLQGHITTLKELAKDKSFLLLDFWGTWCAPCKELTPELVQLNKKYKGKIQFVSLAFEMDSKPVLEYVQENNMNWYNGIIKGKPKSGDMSSPVLGGLRIDCYPTFIVLDSNLNILFRTCGGGNNFLDLKTFLDAQL